MNTESFGKKILSIRQNANLTQEELALRMGVTPQAISKWERGDSMPDIPLQEERRYCMEESRNSSNNVS